MKLLALADLHFDFWTARGLDPFAGAEALLSDVDLLVLAGDVSNKAKIRWKPALERLSACLPADRIAVFPGNHDFYDFRIDDEDRLRDIAESVGATYAQRSELRFDGVRCLCATLWTDMALGGDLAANKRRAAERMNDYRYIRVAGDRYRRLWPEDVIAIHQQHRDWLEEKLATPFDGETWAITHHAPHPGALTPHASDVPFAYASDLSDLIRAHQPARWLYGHCHYGHALEIGATRIENVSLGGPEEAADPAARLRSLIIEI